MKKEYKSNFKKGVINYIIHYIIFPSLFIAVSMLALGSLCIIIISIPTFLKEFFANCFITLFCILLFYLMISMIGNVKFKRSFYQMQIIIHPDYVKISKMTTPFKIIWIKIGKKNINSFIYTKNKNIAILDNKNRLYEIILINKSSHNKEEQMKVRQLLKEVGIKEMKINEFLERFKQGKIIFQ